MENRREVTFAVRKLLNLMRRLADSGPMAHGEATPMQGRVIGYLTHHAGQDVYQRDLEQAFQVRRSTASALLAAMEKGGLLRRESVPWDARLKRLVLTERAEAMHQHFQEHMAQANAMITRGVTPEELEAFFHAVDKFERNLNEYAASQAAEPRPSCRGEECE